MINPEAEELLSEVISASFGQSPTAEKLRGGACREEVSDHGFSVARSTFLQFRRGGYVVTVEVLVGVDVIRPEKCPVDHIPEG